MEQMFREMDADHDGSIGFEEFVAAMKNNLSEEQLARVPALGRRWLQRRPIGPV